MGNVLLINPSYQPSYGGARGGIVNPIHPTLGLATIAAAARAHGHKVDILDLSWRPYDIDLIRKTVIDKKADVVGITATTPLMNQLRDMSVRPSTAMLSFCSWMTVVLCGRLTTPMR